MFVTTSKKTNILQKRFCKYLTKFLPDISYVPRGKTPLFKLFDKARYLGHNHFLKVSFIDGKINLLIYFLKQDSFYLQREYLIEVIDLRHLKSFIEISSLNNMVCDTKKVFYFLSKENLSQKSKYGVFQKQEDVFEFLNDGEYLGFSFKILNVKIFD